MYGKFLVEGDKPVRELLKSNFKIDTIFSVSDWQLSFGNNKPNRVTVTEEELKKISTHENPNQVIAVAEIPKSDDSLRNIISLCLVCDNISDPGNAGTIIRIADWFGIQKVFFSVNSVDIYNPKTVSAAKGSLFRVHCFYTDLEMLFSDNKQMKVYGTFIEGESIYSSSFIENAFILIGNEANGIGEELFPFIDHKISIPSFGNAESLNVAVATGIVVSEFKRRLLKS